mmetsp:Transcript_26864/g.54065  ORF Transcript_26864/g.54065 Transcript_26864/m.54065 type:complete len:261 (+) Transcript_26864:318-1100(+)
METIYCGYRYIEKEVFFFLFLALISPYCSFHSATFAISRPRSFTDADNFDMARSKSVLVTARKTNEDGDDEGGDEEEEACGAEDDAATGAGMSQKRSSSSSPTAVTRGLRLRCCAPPRCSPLPLAFPSSRFLAAWWQMVTTASRHTSLMSLPVYPSSFDATSVKFTSGATRLRFKDTRRIASRVAKSGRSTRILRGMRRKTASSKSNGRFVEPITTTRLAALVCRPSHSCIMVVFTLVSVPWLESSPFSRLLSKESTSSM